MAVKFRVPLVARRIDESDRASSPLELLFDLTFVVAIAQAVAQLVHGIEEGEVQSTLIPFGLTFFAIWWAWMNFTWFSSGYDNDDALYRITTMVQMVGVLILGSGVPAAFEDGDYAVLIFGYFVMRVGLIAQWVRAASADPAHRRGAVRTIVGYGTLQLCWLARLLVSEPWGLWLSVVLIVLELAVPLWAARVGDPGWNPGHIAERFGLFTIILLGESVLAAMTGFQRSITENGPSPELTVVALSAVVTLFALWWLYYLQPSAEGLALRRRFSYIWAYGHYVVFAALAMLGAGLEVAVASSDGHSVIPPWVMGAAVTLPIAAFLVSLWGVNAQLMPEGALRARVLLPSAAIAALLPLATEQLHPVGVVALGAIICAATVVVASRDQLSRTADGGPARRDDRGEPG
ncbi:low temperature requirement protein A [Herbiconiux solani]|uniref:low temperature requirement protein A n=1 Tax=Herbiconiux solani TaxID=661329 RepID=UPI000A4B8D18|nr:low temperature requirement protein A [Herbiconiux solani]